MANTFDINRLAGTIGAAKDKAIKAIGDMGLSGLTEGHVFPVYSVPGIYGENQKGVAAVKSEDYPLGDTKALVSFGDLKNIEADNLDDIKYTIFGTPMCFPLSVKLSSQSNSEWWLLPTEPIITLGGANDLIRRKVSKRSKNQDRRRGTMKESWTEDDIEINIQGLLTQFDKWQYPTTDVQKMRKIVQARETVDVQCALLEIFGIGRIAIDKYNFQFTKGEQNQAFTISAFSDDDWDLLIKLEKK